MKDLLLNLSGRLRLVLALALVCLLPGSTRAATYSVTTFAGQMGVSGSADGTESSARFTGPYHLAMDSAGNIYVGEAFNNTIRKITPAGVVTTIAGTAGVSGATDGTGLAAKFNFPLGVAVHPTTGDVYVGDYGNHTIRKITPAGVVTTFAGTAGAIGTADGTGSAARFNGPSGLLVDSTGTIFVADSSSHIIRKITSAAVVTTFAGTAGVSGSNNGTGTSAKFNIPQGLALDSAGNIFVSELNNKTIRKITPAGVVTTFAGSAGVSGGTDGIGTVARFGSPRGLAMDSVGNLLVADTGGATVRSVSPAGVVTTLAGRYLVGGASNSIVGTNALFGGPLGVAVNTQGVIYVSDAGGNNAIRQLAVAPVNDNFAGRTVISGLTGTFTGSNAGATGQSSEPASHISGVTNSVWWEWTAPTTGFFSVDTLGSTYDTVLAGYYVGAGVANPTFADLLPLFFVGQSDNGAGPFGEANGSSAIFFFASEGVKCFFAVDGVGAATGTTLLNLRGIQPGADSFTQAAAGANLFGMPVVSQGANTNATADAGGPAFLNGGKSLWWTWVAPDNGSVTIETLGSTFDTLLGVYSGTAVGSLTSLAENDDNGTGGTWSKVTFNAVSNATYRIALDAKAGAAGTYALNLRLTPPPQDDFAARLIITNALGSFTATNTLATGEAGEPTNHVNGTNHSLWWQWTAPADGFYFVDTKGSGFDTVLAGYFSTNASTAFGTFQLLFPAGMSDNGAGPFGEAGGSSAIFFFASAGVNCYFAVDGVGSATGMVKLNVRGLLPGYDSFSAAAAQNLFGLPVTATGNSQEATAEAGEPAFLNGGKTVWWTWIAPQSGSVTIETLGSTFDTLLGVYTGTAVNGLTPLGQNDDNGTGGTWSRVTFNAVSNATYRIALDAKAGAAGTYALNLRLTPPALQDNFAARLIITNSLGSFTATNIFATGETGEPASHVSGVTNSVWWQWTVPADGFYFVDTKGSSFDTVLAGYFSTNGSLAFSTFQPLFPAGVSDNGAGPFGEAGGSSAIFFFASAGVNCYFAVDGAAGAVGTVKLNIRGQLPGYDSFSAAAAVTNLFGLPVTATGSSEEATAEAGEPAFLNGGKTVWWTWVAPQTGSVTMDTLGSGFDTLLGVYTGTAVNSLTPLGQNDDNGAGGTWSKVTFNAVSNTVYRIALDAKAGAAGAYVLNVRLAPAVPLDTFANRFAITNAIGSFTATNTLATGEAGEPASHVSGVTNSVWWQWTVPADGFYFVDTKGSSFDTVLAGYFSTNGSTAFSTFQPLFPVGVSDNGAGPFGEAGGSSAIFFFASAGVNCYFAVDGVGSATGTARLNIRGRLPGYDSFGAAAAVTNLFGLPVSATGGTEEATAEAGEPGFLSGGKTVWWTWVAPETTSVTVDTLGSAFDTLLGVYTGGAVNSLSLVAQNDDNGAGGSWSKLTFNAVSNTVYRIALDGKGGTNGAYALNVNYAPPANDHFTNRTTITGVTATVTGANQGATGEPGEPANHLNGATNSVWWQWTAPVSGFYVVDTTGSAVDTVLAAYSASVANPVLGNLSVLTSNDNGSGPFGAASGSSAIVFFAAEGTPYYFGVDGASGAAGGITLNVRGIQPGVNTFADTTALDNLSGFPVKAVGANGEATSETGEPAFLSTKTVWWAWTAPESVSVAIDTQGSDFDTVLGVYTGTAVNGLATVAQNDDNGAGGTWSKVRFAATAGTKYRIAVGGKAGATGRYALNLGHAGSATLSVIGDTTYVVGTAAVPVAPDLGAADPVGGSVGGASVVIVDNLPGDTLTYDTAKAASYGITGTFNSTNGVLTFRGVRPTADYQDLLRTVAFTNPLSDAATGARRVAFSLGADVLFNPDTGHFYKLVTGTHTWAFAKLVAGASSYFGVAGYLATATSLGEQNFIAGKFAQDVWLGASDDVLQINAATGAATYASQSAAEGNFHWVSGPEAGQNFSAGNRPTGPAAVAGRFINWNTNQPDNAPVAPAVGSAHYVQLVASADGKWLDTADAAPSGPGHYVIEYGGLPGDLAVQSAGVRTVNVRSPAFIPSLFNTGVDDLRQPLRDRDPDTHYRLVGSSPITGPAVTVSDANGFPVPPWLSGSTNSSWITPTTLLRAAGNATYTYRTTLDLTGWETNAYIIGQVAADDRVVEIRLNNVLVATPTSSGSNSYTGFGVPIGAPFIAGINQLDFVVTNAADPGQTRSLTGLRVEMFGVGIQVPPSVVLQPQSQTVTYGETALFKVEVNGGQPFTYQWFKDGVLIKGADGPTLTYRKVIESDAGRYQARISNVNGFTLSSEFTLTVDVPLEIYEQPASARVASGRPATFKAKARGNAPVTYQWQKNRANIPGATNATYQIGAVTVLHAGLYNLKATDRDGSVLSQDVTLEVVEPPLIVLQPVDATGVAGRGNAALRVQADGTEPLRYLWLFNGRPFAPGATTNLVLPAFAREQNGGYQVVITNLAGAATSRVAQVTVHAPPAITNAIRDLKAMEGETASFSVGATGDGTLDYQWYRNGELIPGALSASLSYTNLSRFLSGDFAVVVTSPHGVVTNKFRFDIYPLPVPVVSTGPDLAQELTLRPGWNAVFLTVQPTNNTLERVFAGVPLSSVWTWADRGTGAEFIQEQSEASVNSKQWRVYFPTNRPESFQNNLFRVFRHTAYLINLATNQPVTLTLTGEPGYQRQNWAADSYTLTGFPVDGTNGPAVGAFFKPSKAHYDSATARPRGVYRLLANGSWAQLAETDPLAAGEAYWTFTRGASDYLAPVEVEFIGGSSLGYGATAATKELTIKFRNLGATTEQPLLSFDHAVSGQSFPLQISEFSPAAGNTWRDLPNGYYVTADGQATRTIRLMAKRERVPGAVYAGVLRLDANEGVRHDIPVRLERPQPAGAGAPPPFQPVGLWVGSVSVTHISEVNGLTTNYSTLSVTNQVNGVPTVTEQITTNIANVSAGSVPTPVKNPFAMRVIVHVATNGVARLLQEVTVLVDSGTNGRVPVLITQPSLLGRFQGASLVGRDFVGRRISTPFFPMHNTNSVVCSGVFDLGGSLSVSLGLPATSALNPFYHRYHPDHDNLDASFKVFKQEAYPVVRALQFQIPARQGSNARPGVGSDEVEGVYQETITGLHRLPITVRGTFQLKRVAGIGVLDPQPVNP